jgi:hypothetical protein
VVEQDLIFQEAVHHPPSTINHQPSTSNWSSPIGLPSEILSKRLEGSRHENCLLLVTISQWSVYRFSKACPSRFLRGERDAVVPNFILGQVGQAMWAFSFEPLDFDRVWYRTCVLPTDKRPWIRKEAFCLPHRQGPYWIAVSENALDRRLFGDERIFVRCQAVQIQLRQGSRGVPQRWKEGSSVSAMSTVSMKR